MKYYRVRKESHDYFTGWTAIKNELITRKERETRFRYLMNDVFEEVEISRKKTYMSFGVRFEIAKS